MPTERPARVLIPTGRVAIGGMLAAAVVGARLWLMQVWGSPVPFWDQWDGEGLALYQRWLAGTLGWRDILAAHNEHRMAVTRLADLALFATLGSWDTWAQMLLNAALHAATAAGLIVLFWPALTRGGRLIFAAAIALLFSAPCGWQNALCGFQSVVYFGNLLALLAIAGLCGASPWSSRWWIGFAAAVASLLTHGGGGFVALAALGVSLFSVALAPRNARAAWASAAATMGIIAAGLALFVTPPGHTAMHAHTVTEFWLVLTHCLAWPHVDRGWMAAIMQLPLLLLAVVHVYRRTPPEPAERCALALGLLAALTAAGIAFGRGGVLPDARPISRYHDPLLLGAAAQLFAALSLAHAWGRNGRLLMLLWSGTAAVGLLALTVTNLTVHLPYKQAHDRASLALVRAYLASGDAEAFAHDSFAARIHPNPAMVRAVLDDPRLRPRLPAALLARDESAAEKPWPIAHGAFLAAASAALFAALLVLAARRDQIGFTRR